MTMDIIAISEDKQEIKSANDETKLEDSIQAARDANSTHGVKAGSLDSFAMNRFPKRPPKLFW